MNTDQIMSLVRTGAKIGGTMLVTFGVMEAGQSGVLVDSLVTGLGAILTAGGIIMSYFKHKA